MPFVSRVVGMWRAVTRSEDLDQDVDHELRCYLELLIDEKIRGGMDAGSARREALIELGGVEQVKTAVRSSLHGAALNSLLVDIRHTLRMWRREPGFAFVVALTLALGIGANTAVFSTVNAVIIRDIPFNEPERLVAGGKSRNGEYRGPISRLDFFDLDDRSSSFEALAAFVSGRGTITGGQTPEVVGVMFSTWDLLPTLGVDPVLGRHLLPEEEIQGGSDSTLISYGLWQRSFGGDPEIIGTTITLNGMPRTIVGVAPPGFRFMDDVDLWLPIERGDFFLDRARDSHSLRLLGRLRPGVSRAEAQRDLEGIAKALAEEFPDTNQGKGVMLFDLQRFMADGARTSLLVLMATTVVVLLIACGNVAGLMLARGQRRVSEMAMRSALGASRRRLVRQLLTESVVITLLAGAVGIGLAVLFQRLLLQLLPLGRPGLPEPSLDGQVLLFTVVVSLLAGTVVGVIPAIRVTTADPWGQLKAVSALTEGRRSGRVRDLLVAVQVAMSVTLLVGSGLLIRTMVNLRTVDLGFSPDRLLAGTVGIDGSAYETPEQRSQFFSALVERVEALPGVVSAATVSKLPIASPATDWPIWHANEPRPSSGEGDMALARWVTPGYFATMGIRLLEGRDIEGRDAPGEARVLVISKAVAEGMFPRQDPVGRMVKLGWSDEVYEIVGVVGNAKLDGVRSGFDWAMYMASAQVSSTSQWLAVRCERDPDLLVEPIRATIRDMDRDVVFFDPTPMSEIIDDNLSGSWTVTVALGLLAAIALLLTSVGLYGVLAYHVSQRAGELGVRVALGAPLLRLVSSVVARGARMVVAGLVAGVAISLFLTRTVQGLLFDISPMDPTAFTGAVLFLGAIAFLACALPVWRASQVNPMQVLRKE